MNVEFSAACVRPQIPEPMLEVLAVVMYRDWSARLHCEGNDILLQVQFVELDPFTQRRETQRGRKWVLSRHATRSELVLTVLKAILTAEEHEARERFTYRGQPIFQPHLDVEHLHTLCQGDHTDVRTPGGAS